MEGGRERESVPQAADNNTKLIANTPIPHFALLYSQTTSPKLIGNKDTHTHTPKAHHAWALAATHTKSQHSLPALIEVFEQMLHLGGFSELDHHGCVS